MKKIFSFLLSFGLLATIHAQESAWKSNNDAPGQIIKDKAVSRLSFPKQFKLYDLNQTRIKDALFAVIGTNRRTTVIEIPNAAGQMEQFEVVEASNFEPALQAQFPEIRAFSGKGINDPGALLKLSYSPQGIQTIIFRNEGTECIEPFSKDHAIYAVFKSIRANGSIPWSCTTPEQVIVNNLNDQVNNAGNSARSGGDLKTMRLAQSCNAEYSNYFGATSSTQVGLVLAAFNATLTRANGVYEKDLALHLNLIANTASVIYYNTATDPYSTTLSQWNAQLQSTLTSVIGEANYDIGHMFGASGGGGNAGCIGCVCVNGSKGSGITSPFDGIPQGDNFDIDYVAHEVGHQLGGNHTFSHNLEGTGVNKEVGSGITVMGYAGITAQDVAPHSIAYFHQASIAQIQANLATKTCPVTTVLANATPVLSTVANATIPISTPFALTGVATDANAGDVLTYSWEQNDNSTVSGASSVASATKASGPNWISFAPSTSPTRLFPKLSTILAGGLISGPNAGGDAGANTEALSSVSRTLNFRLTVRDNAPYSSAAPVSVGQTQFTNVVVTVSNTSGPFAVTVPNTAVTWNVGTAQNVTWSVNNTTAAPVSCANVKISLSTDGGQTYPTVLAASTPNDGSESITVPNLNATTCRIKVEAVGNIFFDISNANFTISGTPPACGTPTALNANGITNTSATVNWTAVSGALNYTVDYKLNSATTWTNAATAITTTSTTISGLTQGTLYDYRVRANCSGGASANAQAQFTTTTPSACNAPTGLTSSAITSSGANVSWTAVSGAVSYDLDYKLNSATTWTNAVMATTATSRAIPGLTASTLYDWRVRSNCASLSSTYSQAQFTTAAVSTCPGPLDVSTNGTATGAATIPFNTDVKGTISSTADNDYYKFVITTGGTATITLTTLPADFDIRLYSSNGTTQLAISQNAGTTSETISRTYTAGTYYVRVYGYMGANSTTSCYTLKVQLGTAAKQEDNSNYVNNVPKFSIYPNPTTDKVNLNITGIKDRAIAQIIDLNGKMLQQSKLINGNNSIAVQSLKSGIYFIKVTDTEGVMIHQDKFIKE